MHLAAGWRLNDCQRATRASLVTSPPLVPVSAPPEGDFPLLATTRFRREKKNSPRDVNKDVPLTVENVCARAVRRVR